MSRHGAQHIAGRFQMPSWRHRAWSVVRHFGVSGSRKRVVPVFVAEDDSIIGFCDLIPSRDKDAGQAVGEIAAIYVLCEHWRKGAGRALCDCALSEARQRGYGVVTLWVLASNSGARRFYETMGFSLDGVTKTEKASDGSELHEIRFHRRVA